VRVHVAFGRVGRFPLFGKTYFRYFTMISINITRTKK
jgi:hypothetical protein